MNNDWAFLPMRDANPLLGDTAGLRARLEEDGYLLFRSVIDPAKVRRLRLRMLQTLADQGWVQGGKALLRGAAISQPVFEGRDDFAEGYDAVQRLEELHTLAHDEDLTAVMRQVVGESAWPHPLKIARLSFPSNYEMSTPPHQDYPNNQGTERLTASWIPVGDCNRELGGLAVLRGSHRYGVLPLATHPGAGNRQAVLPPEMLEELRWVTTDYQMGDVLVFPSLTVHASLHNASEIAMRLSVDYRWQQEGEALTEGVLAPHFGRLTWDEIYAGWQSTEHQYYWRDLDYEVVPFVDHLAPDFTDDDGKTLHAAIMEKLRDGSLKLQPDEFRWLMTFDRKNTVRFERRQRRLTELLRQLDEDEPTAVPDSPVGASSTSSSR